MFKHVFQTRIIQKLNNQQTDYWEFSSLYCRETTIMNWQNVTYRRDVGEFKFPAQECVLIAVLIQQEESVTAVNVNISLNGFFIFI